MFRNGFQLIGKSEVMLLELTITSYQRLSPSVVSRRRVEPGQVVVAGRSPECDWHLPDPARVLSSKHAEFRFSDGDLLITDTSTNGVFLNGDQSPLGSGNTAIVRAGDTLRLGDFELAAVSHAEAGAPSAGEGMSREVPAVADTADIPLTDCAPEPALAASASVQEQPVANDFRDFLGAGLGERVMSDSHVSVQEPAIPGEWRWGHPETPSAPSNEAQNHAGTSSAGAEPAHNIASATAGSGVLSALLEGLGLGPERVKDADSRFGLQLGSLTRVLLDRLLDMMHVRARQKQQLRVAQTLFQRSENNPLKFSATPQDALDSLLLRPHAANLGPADAVNRAFDDLFSHEQALLKGVEAVVQDILSDPPGMTESKGAKGIFARRKTLATIIRHRAWQQEIYGSTDKMLRSDVFIEAYEQAVDPKDEGARV